jgi:hypothetical protein
MEQTEKLEIPNGAEWLGEALEIEVDESNKPVHDKHSGTKDTGTKHKD